MNSQRRMLPADRQPAPLRACTFILDGHNILYASRPAFLEHLEDGHPRSAAREEFIRRLARAFPAPGPAVMLYYDGSKPQDEARSDRVRVIYSGGDGDQRADRAILRQVSAHAAAGEAAVVVVTRDLKLARRARKRGALVMAPAEFLEAWRLGA